MTHEATSIEHTEQSSNGLPYIGDGNLRQQSAANILDVIDRFNEATLCGTENVDETLKEIGISRTIFFALVRLRCQLEIAARSDVPVWGAKGINPILEHLRTGKTFDVAPARTNKPSTPAQYSKQSSPPFGSKSNPRRPPENSAVARQEAKPAHIQQTTEEETFPPEEAHLAFLIHVRRENGHVVTRAVSMEQRGMITDYYETLKGYGKKGDFFAALWSSARAHSSLERPSQAIPCTRLGTGPSSTQEYDT